MADIPGTEGSTVGWCGSVSRWEFRVAATNADNRGAAASSVNSLTL
ncbi:MAG: hypothetical protein ACLTE2_04610 [Eubacteriales bacterium]